METIKLTAKTRDAGKALRALRTNSMVPAVVYGHGTKNRNLAVSYNEFAKAFKTAGESSLIDIDIEGDGSVKVLVKDTQVQPLTGRFTHVDFYEVNLKEKLRAEIALNFVGESPAVKELGGSLVKSLDSLSVECLPTDLVPHIDVDVTSLKAFDQMIHVKDLVVPPGITVLDNPEEVVVLAEAPMTEEQYKAMEAAPAAAVDVTAVKTEAEIKKAEEEAKKAAEAEAAKE